jgi:hypothetical protein
VTAMAAINTTSTTNAFAERDYYTVASVDAE